LNEEVGTKEECGGWGEGDHGLLVLAAAGGIGGIWDGGGSGIDDGGVEGCVYVEEADSRLKQLNAIKPVK